jgi:putative ABC transport system ATP-binding protein
VLQLFISTSFSARLDRRWQWVDEMLLSVAGLTKTYDTLTVLDGVSFTLDAGETLALTGESGSGKSTLIHLVAALDRPDSGRVEILGQDTSGLDDAGLAALRRDTIGVVFQQFNLIPSLNAGDNLAFQARMTGRGQQQRVAIGRALAARPRLVLADEPTGNLDQTTGDATFKLMRDLVGDSGAGLIMATHSTRLAAQLGRRLHLSGGRLV